MKIQKILFLILTILFLNSKAFSKEQPKINILKTIKLGPIREIDLIDKYNTIVKELADLKISNNTAKLFILNLISLTLMCVIPNNKKSTFYQKIVLAKGAFFILYPLLKRLIVTKNDLFLKKLNQLQNILQQSTYSKQNQIINLFKKRDAKLILNKFSRLKYFLFLTDSLILIEGGRNLFLACLSFVLNNDWEKICEAYHLAFSNSYKVCSYFILSLFYYIYCKIVHNDFLNSKEANIFKKIIKLSNKIKYNQKISM